MYQEIDAGIEDIKKGGWNNDTQAALQFGLAILQIPQALNTCENMDQDIAAIESWAQIFTNPAKLSKTLAKHYAFHKSEIKADISTLEADWTAKEYFKAGDDLAALMTVAIGPIETSEVASSSKATADFVAGFIKGMTGNDYQTEIESCFDDEGLVTTDIQAGFKFLKKGDDSPAKLMYDFHAIQEFGSAIKQMPAALSSCDGMDDDLTAIATWAEIFDDTAKLTSYCGWHYTFY